MRFRARRLEIITRIAQHAALAIQNDLLQKEMVVRERLETEAQLACQIQQTFLPTRSRKWRLGLLSALENGAPGGRRFLRCVRPAQPKDRFVHRDVADKGVPRGVVHGAHADAGASRGARDRVACPGVGAVNEF
ncbi:MAG: hypothetical protein IPM31_10870 [Anaerolineae bacterium]|nr:hypothetical protein [Anaerolineae bacterium]